MDMERRIDYMLGGKRYLRQILRVHERDSGDTRAQGRIACKEDQKGRGDDDRGEVERVQLQVQGHRRSQQGDCRSGEGYGEGLGRSGESQGGLCV